MAVTPPRTGEEQAGPTHEGWTPLPEPPSTWGSGGGWADILIAPARVVALFGLPHRRGDGQKVTGIYFFQGPDAVYHTLYDWKQTAAAYPDDHELPSEFWSLDHGTLCVGGCQSRVEDFGRWLADVLERELAPRLRELTQEATALIDAGEPGAAYAKLIENRRISDDLSGYKARAPLSLPSAEQWAVEPFRDHEDVRRFDALLSRAWAGKRREESVLGPLFRWWWKAFPPKA